MAPWGDSVQHLRFTGVRMDRPGRLFVCARCRVQVVLCRRCDHGQRYCTRSCSRQARGSARRRSAQRYQRSRGGRRVHAARSRRWRERQPRIDPGPSDALANKVTHQGSQDPVPDAPLAEWSPDSATSKLRPLTQACTSAQAGTLAATLVATLVVESGATPVRCRRCGAALVPWVRQGFLRRAASRRMGLVLRHDHSP